MSTPHHIEELIALAETHIARRAAQPSDSDPAAPAAYFAELHSEVDEAEAEVKAANAIYLEDELGDIFWDYCLLLAYLAQQGYIDSAAQVFTHALAKYQERAPAMEARSDELWKKIKQQQRQALAAAHNARYHDSESDGSGAGAPE